MRQVTLASALLLVAAACSSSGDRDPVDPIQTKPDRSLSANIDGRAWKPLTVEGSVTKDKMVLSGTNAVGLTMFVVASFVDGPGTQVLGGTGLPLGIVRIGATDWTASSGSLTITTLTSTRAVGTFSFTAPANDGRVLPTLRQVTSGAFDVTIVP